MRLYDIGDVLTKLPTCAYQFDHGFDFVWEAYHTAYASFYELESIDINEAGCLSGFLNLPEYKDVIELADLLVELGESTI